MRGQIRTCERKRIAGIRKCSAWRAETSAYPVSVTSKVGGGILGQEYGENYASQVGAIWWWWKASKRQDILFVRITKFKRARQTVRHRGCIVTEMLAPPRSPDMNLLKNTWNCFKRNMLMGNFPNGHIVNCPDTSSWLGISNIRQPTDMHHATNCQCCYRRCNVLVCTSSDFLTVY